MKKNVFFTVFLGFSYIVGFAQSADKTTDMINAQTVTFEQTAYFAASYLGLGTEDMSGTEAVVLLTQAIDLSKLNTSEQMLTFKNFAYLCMKTWNLRGGLNYRIFKSPRFALRELKAMRFVAPFTDPDAYISGREALYVMGKCASAAESGEEQK